MSRASKSKSKNIKRLNESILNEACINAGNKCTAAISCGGDSNYHGTVSFSCSCNTPAGNFGSGWIDCGHSEGTGVGGDLPYELTGDKTRTEKKGGPVVIWPSKKDKLEEGCGCDGGKETSKDSYMAASQLHSISNKAEDMYNKLEKDEVLDDWVESHLAKIDQMMDSVSDSFNHDQYKHAGDMGPGGCPPGHHWCAASDSCRSDNAPQTEPLTLMGADVVSLNEQSEDKEVDVKTLIKKYEPQGKKTEPPTHPSVILGDNEGVIKEQVAGCTASTNPNARKVYFWWVDAGIMPPGPNGIWPGCPPPCNQLPACQPPVGCNWSFGQPMPVTAGTPPSCIWSGTWLKAVTVNGQAPQPGDIIDWTTGIKQCSGTALNLSNTVGNLIGVYAAVQPNFPTAEVIDFGGGATPCTVYGCTDPTALNYNSTILPNCDDNSCIPGNTVFGCMDSTASNYDPTATMDDGSCIPSCDTTPASACAQQWFQNPNATWAANWINNRDCSNYNWPSINLEQQANTIMAGAPNQPTIPYTYNSWNDIWGAANSSGLPNTGTPNVKAQFIAKMAKAKFSQCQIQACNC